MFEAHVRSKFCAGNLGYKRLFFFMLIFALINFSLYSSQKNALHCYEERLKDDSVLNLPDYNVTPNSIFFLETSCHHGGGVKLTTRQACAFESAAKAHPNSEILVLFPSPISLRNPSLLVSRLLEYPNIKLLRVDVDRYFANTPLEGFEMRRKMAESSWPETHASDVLRVLTLWKYGGTYFDTDFIILRPVNMMANFAGAQSPDLVNNAVMNFNISDEGGKKIIDEMILEVRDNYLPNDWGNIGPGAISRVLRRICNETDIRKMTPEKCSGFRVFPPPPGPSPFYRVSYDQWRVFFDEKASQAVLNHLAQSYALHLWNAMSKGGRAKVNSRMPYSVFASRFCPRVYSTVVDYF